MKVHYIREFYSNLELGRFQGAQATEMPIHPHVLALKQFYISKHFILSWDKWWGLPTLTADVSSRLEATTYISRQRFAVISPGHTAPAQDILSTFREKTLG